MELHLDTVFIWVNDLEISLPWYRSLGLEPGALYGPWQEMTLGGDTRFALHQGNRPPGESTAVPSFRVADLDSEIARLAKAGVTPSDREITNTGAARFITFADPDGNQIQLIER